MTSGRMGRETSWEMVSLPPHPLQINVAEKLYISSFHCSFFWDGSGEGQSLLLIRGQITLSSTEKTLFAKISTYHLTTEPMR